MQELVEYWEWPWQTEEHSLSFGQQEHALLYDD
jgi:hypothetical protein